MEFRIFSVQLGLLISAQLVVDESIELFFDEIAPYTAESGCSGQHITAEILLGK